MKDFRGTEIKVGSVIVYPGRQSSSVWMNEGTVEEIGEETRYDRSHMFLRVRRTGGNGWRRNEPERKVKLTALENVVVVG